MATVEWTYEDDERGWLVDVEVTASLVPYVPARVNCRNDDARPAEGGYLEDESFVVVGFKLEVGNHVHEIPLTAVLSEALGLEVEKAYSAEDRLREEVYKKFEANGREDC